MRNSNQLCILVCINFFISQISSLLAIFPSFVLANLRPNFHNGTFAFQATVRFFCQINPSLPPHLNWLDGIVLSLFSLLQKFTTIIVHRTTPGQAKAETFLFGQSGLGGWGEFCLVCWLISIFFIPLSDVNPSLFRFPEGRMEFRLNFINFCSLQAYRWYH